MTLTADPGMALGLNIDDFFAVRILILVSGSINLRVRDLQMQDWDDLLNVRGMSSRSMSFVPA